MTTARVKYRDFVPYDWFTIEFCNVDFYGNNAESFTSKWQEIQYEKYNKLQPEIDCIENDILRYRKEVDRIEQELKQIKKWGFWLTFKKKMLLQQKSVLMQNIKDASVKQKSLEKNQFYEASELVCKAETFLKDNGFILTDTERSGSECITHTDLWVRE